MNKRLVYIPIVVVVLLLMYSLISIETSASGYTLKTVFFHKDFSKETNLYSKSKDFKIPDSSEESENIPISRKHIIVIDAGHGGNDAGTNDNGVIEKEITLDIALKIDSILKGDGIQTYMIRTTDKFIDHRDRINSANQLNASLYLSIHCDWFKDSSLHGTQILYYPSASLMIGNLKEKEYASIIQTELIKALKSTDRGIDDRSELAVLRRANMPSVLVELGFISNQADAQKLQSHDFRQKAAEGFAEGLKKSLAKIVDK